MYKMNEVVNLKSILKNRYTIKYILCSCHVVNFANFKYSEKLKLYFFIFAYLCKLHY